MQIVTFDRGAMGEGKYGQWQRTLGAVSRGRYGKGWFQSTEGNLRRGWISYPWNN